MMTLYGLQGSCSLAPHIALEEAGLPFEYVMIRKGNEEDRKKLISLNSMAQVPVLVRDGQPITQNLVLLPLIASLAPEKGLLPEEGTAERLRADEWLAFLATTIHPAFGPFFIPSVFHPEPAQHPALAEQAGEQIARVFAVAEERAGDGPWLLGDRFSLVDVYLFVFFRWLRFAKVDGAVFPKLQRVADAVRGREATARAMSRENVRT